MWYGTQVDHFNPVALAQAQVREEMANRSKGGHTVTAVAGPCMFCSAPLTERMVVYPHRSDREPLFRWLDERELPHCPELEGRGQISAPFHQPWFDAPDTEETA